VRRHASAVVGGHVIVAIVIIVAIVMIAVVSTGVSAMTTTV
jgi:hypothetical protein